MGRITSEHASKSYPGLQKSSKTEYFVTLVNSLKSLTIVSKRSILDIYESREYAFVYLGKKYVT